MENAVLITNTNILFLDIDKIKPNPYQPRKMFDRASIEELAASIAEYGVLQPISVRLINGMNYELVAGERRLRASKLAGLTKIPSIVINISDKDSAILAIIENLQRDNLNFIDEAEGYSNLIRDYGFTQDQLAQKVSKTQSTIANKLRLLRLTKKVQRKVLESELTERHARALLKLDSEQDQLEIIDKITKQALTVKKTEELIEGMLKKKEIHTEKNQKVKMYIRDLRVFTNTIAQAVEMVKKCGVEVDYTCEKSDGGYEINILVLT